MASSAPLVKAYLVDTALPAAVGSGPLVCYGEPGAYQPDEIVAVLDQRITYERPTMGTSRTREEVVETTVTVSVFQSGDETRQRVVTERAWEIAHAISQWFRTSPNETLGGSCREAWVTEGELAEAKVTPAPGPGGAPAGVQGRLAELSLLIVTRSRP